MKTPIIILITSLSLTATAQIRPPARQVVAVVNPDMVIEDRGAKLEIYPERRLDLLKSSEGMAVMQERSTRATSTTPFSGRPALAFNHAYQQYGYVTGEVTFKFKSGVSRPSLSSVAPGARKVGNLDMFVVVATSPTELVALVERLKARTDLQWVEPTVKYIPFVDEAGRRK
jgi:hypothetical protein